jgi:hypothetical protein
MLIRKELRAVSPERPLVLLETIGYTIVIRVPEIDHEGAQVGVGLFLLQ